MRELVYVSETKLRQLSPDLPKGSNRLRDMEAEVRTPLGGFKVGKAAQESDPGLADEKMTALEHAEGEGEPHYVAGIRRVVDALDERLAA